MNLTRQSCTVNGIDDTGKTGGRKFVDAAHLALVKQRSPKRVTAFSRRRDAEAHDLETRFQKILCCDITVTAIIARSA